MNIPVSDEVIKRIVTLGRISLQSKDCVACVPFPSDSFLVNGLYKYVDRKLPVDTRLRQKYDLILAYQPFDPQRELATLISLYESLKVNGRLVCLSKGDWKPAFTKDSTHIEGWLQGKDAYIDELPPLHFNKKPGKILVIDNLGAPVVENVQELQKPALKINNMKKVKLQRDPLLAVLKKVKEVVSKHPTLDVLSNILVSVHLSTVELIATDQIVTIVGEVDCQHEESGPFKFLLPFDFMLDVVGMISGPDVVIETDLKKAVINGSNESYDLGNLESVDLFPAVPEFPEENSLEINSDFTTWLTRALDTVSKDANLPNLQKVFMNISDGKLAIASTNAFVVFEKTLEIQEGTSAELLISPKVVKALKGFSETEIAWNSTHVAFQSANISLIGTLQDEKYPAYHRLFRSESANVMFSRGPLVDCIKKAALANSLVNLKLNGSELLVESEDANKGRSVSTSVPMDRIEDSAEPCAEISFTSEHLLKALEQVQYDKICMYITEPDKAVQLSTDSDDTYRAVVVPFRA